MTFSMTPRQIMDAYRAIQELSNIVLPYKTARRVVSLKKRLNEEFDVVLQMENAMVQEFGGRREKDGRIEFSDGKTAEAFLEKYDPAMEETTEIQLPQLDLSEYAGIIRISPRAVEALDRIIAFGEAEDGR